LWGKLAGRLLGLVVPDDCRLCGDKLRDADRYPVCRPCLSSVEPFSAEYHCRSCRTPFRNDYPLDESGRCALCRSGLTGFDSAGSFALYDGSMRRLIHLFKYRGIQSLARPFGKMMARAVPLDQHIDLILPMPMHWRRRFSRGYNQAELLAAELARRTGLPVERKAVKRCRATSPQSELSGAARRKNVAGAFQVARPLKIRGKNVLLVDDVFTTGATARACALALKRAGAEQVVVLTLARADRRQWTEPLWISRGDGQANSFALGAS
jgi:ComF family protein